MKRAVKCSESEDVEDVEAVVNQDIQTIKEKIHNLEDAIQRFGRFTSILENPKVKKAITITMVILAFTVGVFFLLQYKILGITTFVLLTGIELWLVNYSHKRDFDLPQKKNELRILKKQRDAMESQLGSETKHNRQKTPFGFSIRCFVFLSKKKNEFPRPYNVVL